MTGFVKLYAVGEKRCCRRFAVGLRKGQRSQALLYLPFLQLHPDCHKQEYVIDCLLSKL